MNKESKIIRCNSCSMVLGVLTARGLLIDELIISSEKNNFIKITCGCGEAIYTSIQEHENGDVYRMIRV